MTDHKVASPPHGDDLQKDELPTVGSDDAFFAAPGSISRPYKLCIVGGGPAGYSIFVRAMRTGLMDELCSDGKEQNTTTIAAGVCIFDSGKENRLGGGRLQDYSISSNTWGNKFYSNVVEDKPKSLPAESIKGTSLEDLMGNGTGSSEAGRMLDCAGPAEAPLKTVGKFLVDVASAVHNAIRSYGGSSKVKSETKVTCIQRVTAPPPSLASSICSESKSSSLSSDCTDRNLWKVSYDDSTTGLKGECFASNVALATGGMQRAPDLGSKALNGKVLVSDHVCTDAGIADLRTMLLKQGGSLDKKRIVIVGGSHSAFSAAWMCLHALGLTNEESNKHGSLGNSSIIMLYRSAVRVFYATKKEADSDGYDDIGIINKTTGQIHPFGGIRGDSKKLWRDVRGAREPRVRMIKAPGANLTAKLYDEATVIVWACGYETNAVPVLDTKGDRVELRVDQGQLAVDDESRLSIATFQKDLCMTQKLVHSSLTAPEKRTAKSTLVTTSAKCDSKDEVGNGDSSSAKAESKDCKSPGPAPRESKLCVSPTRMSKDKVNKSPPSPHYPVEGLMGLGLGYGLKATLNSSDTLDGSSGRADGVAVYLKRAATLVLANVLGPKVFGVRPDDYYGPDGEVANTNGGADDHQDSFISSWDERADILNDMKKKALKLEREAKEESERSEKEQDREARREAKTGMDGLVARMPKKPSIPSGGSSLISNNTSVSDSNRSKILKFPAIGNGTKESSSESTEVVFRDNNKPRRSVSKGFDDSNKVNRPATKYKVNGFSTNSGGGSLSNKSTYTMSSEFQKKLNTSIDESRVSSCVDRLSKPRIMQTCGKPVDSGKLTRTNIVRQVKSVNPSVQKPLSADNAIGSVKQAWCESKDEEIFESSRSMKKAALSEDILDTSGMDESKSNMPSSSSISCLDSISNETAAIEVPLSPIKLATNTTENKPVPPALFSPLKTRRADSTSGGQGILSTKGPLAICRSTKYTASKRPVLVATPVYLGLTAEK